MMKLLALNLLISMAQGLELPEQAHTNFSWWMDVSINDVSHRVRIWANGAIEIEFYDGIHPRTEGKSGNVDKEWAAKAYELARAAVGPLKLNGQADGKVERMLVLDFDLDVGGLIISIKESALKPGLYQQCIDHVLAAERATGIRYVEQK